MRYGVYGGSFDPIHLGHLAAAEAVRDARGLDRVLLVVAATPPHKRDRRRAPFADRLAMVELAVAGRAGLVADDREGRRAGPSYTVDTLGELRAALPQGAPELLVGADMLADLPTWHRADDIVATTPIVAFARPGWDDAEARDAFRARFPAARVAWVEIPRVDASSTEIRRRLRAGEPVTGLVTPAVAAYLRKNRLYRVRG